METLRFNNTFQHLHITYICVGIVHAYIHKNCVLQSNVNCTFIHMYEYILHLVSIISKVWRTVGLQVLVTYIYNIMDGKI